MEIPNSAFSRVLDSVSKEIMNILLEIDDKVGNVDDLDVSLPDSKQDDLNRVINLHMDSFINVGDNNNLVDTNVAGETIQNPIKKPK